MAVRLGQLIALIAPSRNELGPKGVKFRNPAMIHIVSCIQGDTWNHLDVLHKNIRQTMLRQTLHPEIWFWDVLDQNVVP